MVGPFDTPPPRRGFSATWWRNGAVVFYGLFLLEMIVLFVSQLGAGYARESNNVTEWLIDYQGGFVRRGLSGEVLYHLSRWTGASPYYPLLALCVGLYAWLAAYFYRALRGRTALMLLLPYVFFLGEPIINDFWVRKDVLMVLLFIAILKLTVRYDKPALVLANGLLIVGLLIHEPVGFYCFPILILLLFHRDRRDGRSDLSAAAAAIGKVLPSLAAFLLVLYNKGSVGIAAKIWDSWRPITFPMQDSSAVEPPGSIDALSWSLWKGLAFTRNTLTNFQGGIYAPLAWVVILCTIYFVLTNHLKQDASGEANSGKAPARGVRAIFFFQLVAILPLFVLGWDYSRWVFLWVSSSFAVYLIVPPQTVAEMFPARLVLASERFADFLDRVFGSAPPVVRLLPFLIGVPGASWSVETYVVTTPVYLSLHLVSTVLQSVLSVCLHKKL